MSAHIREAVAALKHDTAALKLAPPAQVRARGEALRRKRVAGSVAAASVLTAVGVFAAVSATADRGTNPSPPPVGASAAVTSAAALDCGSHKLGPSEGLPPAAITCFLDAVEARRPARLAEIWPTIEGDLIRTDYVADSDGAVQVTMDTRQDRFGSRRITRRTCTGPVVDDKRIGFTQCSSPEAV
ncbi:hypothetical protein SAMN05444365_10540 [Micromonospora pattaloongensis]|uniref:Uncharacterized protein n=1 Tax=Micromonospora pattaloongensis TaxID=405436 RepID=A0A1H3PV54_9ACTN|nr:hypothetical protein [Micromonospora pattaloongensis]SDZ04821.1 hypothetical protein SAMN05444365_10540 [Micromonospora pattaloongensis]